MNWRYHCLTFISALFLLWGSANSAPYKVYLFLSETCPLSQYYTLTLKTLHEKYASEHIKLIGVFPNRLSTPSTVNTFKKKYGLPFPCTLDTDHALVRHLGATVTPEVVVVQASGQPLYQGRIDNNFAQVGKRRRVITEHDLANVLDALSTENHLTFRQTQAIGCFITALPNTTQE